MRQGLEEERLRRQLEAPGPVHTAADAAQLEPARRLRVRRLDDVDPPGLVELEGVGVRDDETAGAAGGAAAERLEEGHARGLLGVDVAEVQLAPDVGVGVEELFPAFGDARHAAGLCWLSAGHLMEGERFCHLPQLVEFKVREDVLNQLHGKVHRVSAVEMLVQGLPDFAQLLVGRQLCLVVASREQHTSNLGVPVRPSF